MALRIAIPDMISPSYFPAIAAVELGYFAEEELDASIDLVYPVAAAYAGLRDGSIDYVGGAAHAALYVFEDWTGCKLLRALSQNMYWFLVVRSDLEPRRGDLSVVRGLRIGAAPGPIDGLVRMLTDAGINPDDDLEIVPVPGTQGTSVSFGVTAAKALEDGRLDGFWANGMGAEVAVRNGSGSLLIDARRGDGPNGTGNYTFAAFATSQAKIDDEPDEVARATRAIAAAQRTLRHDPTRATDAAQPHFPEYELSLISELVARDGPFYDPNIRPDSVSSLNDFAFSLGLLSSPSIPYKQVVADQFSPA